MNLEELRKNIDQVDTQIADLFRARMELSLKVAQEKRDNNLPLVSPTREQEILQRISEYIGKPLHNYAQVLFNTLFDLSRSYQKNYLSRTSDASQEVSRDAHN